MISPDQRALAVGSAKLVVDGTDEMLVRKAEISLSPSRSKIRALNALVEWSRDIDNGSLQHRRDAWRIAKVSIHRFDQFKEIRSLREVCPEVARFGHQPARGAISRVDIAFDAFFRRTRNGETPGHPRFKSPQRFHTAFYDEPSSWYLRGLGPDDPESKRSMLYVQGVGEILLSKSSACQLKLNLPSDLRQTLNARDLGPVMATCCNQ